MSERPDLDNVFGTRIATAYRPDPEKGENAWVATHVWDTPDHWILTELSGVRAYDWEYAQECLGEEEEAGRFASFAKAFLPKSDVDAPAIKQRMEAAFADDGHHLAWWSGWQV